jgi:hypothetical protein
MPTTWQVFKRQGLRAAINFKAERLCMIAINDAHRKAKAAGFSLYDPTHKFPWWFKLASKLEWWTRR